MQAIRLLEGSVIRSLLPDMRRVAFAFSPEYLAAVAHRRSGRAGVVVLDTPAGLCFVPIVLFRRKFLKLGTILSPPSDVAGTRLEARHEATALEALTAYLHRTGLAHRLTQPTNWSVFQSAPRGAVTAPFGSYVLPLGAGIDALWRGLHQKNRNVIRSAEKAGIEVAEGPEQLDACFSLYQATMLRNRMSHEPRSLLQDLMRSDDFNVFCGVAYAGERPVSALFAPYNEHGAYYLFGGTSEDIGVNGANNLLHFQAIRAFSDRGVAAYDFVGARLGVVENARLQGIQRFKSRFGSELRQGLIWKQDLATAPCRAYDALLSVRNRALGRPSSSDIIDQEQARQVSGAGRTPEPEHLS